MVDGGIDATTAPLAAAAGAKTRSSRGRTWLPTVYPLTHVLTYLLTYAGANALVSGSYLFAAPPGAMAERIQVLTYLLTHLLTYSLTYLLTY